MKTKVRTAPKEPRAQIQSQATPDTETKARTLNDVIQKKTGRDMLAMIPTTIEPIMVSRKMLKTVRTGMFNTTNRSYLLNLPAEMLAHIFRLLRQDAACYLARSCKFTMQFSLAHKLVEFKVASTEVDVLLRDQVAHGLAPCSRLLKVGPPALKEPQ